MNEQELVRYQGNINNYQASLIDNWKEAIQYQPEYSDDIPETDILEYLFGLEL